MSRRPPKQKPMTNFLLQAIRASGKNLFSCVARPESIITGLCGL